MQTINTNPLKKMSANFGFALVVLSSMTALTVMSVTAGCGEQQSGNAMPVKNDVIGKPVFSLPGASADGTAAPSVPSAAEALAQKPTAATAAAKASGTDDMKKPLTKIAEETQMPMVGHGNNHSAPDGNAVGTNQSTRVTGEKSSSAPMTLKPDAVKGRNP